MSHRPGSTLMPSVEITSAPAGIASAPCTPTAVMRSPSISTTLLRTRPAAEAVDQRAADERLDAVLRRPLLTFRYWCDCEREDEGDEQGSGCLWHGREYNSAGWTGGKLGPPVQP